MKPELFSTPLGAATLGAEAGAIIATSVAAFQGNIPAEMFDVVIALAIVASNRELRTEALNLLKPKIKS